MNAMAPAMTMASAINVVATGRLMKGDDILITFHRLVDV
ncbi:hypothetical protein PAMC26577_37560 [Caballeronia sordidicola]|uniref:Uncharacterized protein n=1 Tax=Caballeronia sordidicola TaxID=196367 RepID=A0A242M5X9_CABSO|nr:hypothetical protein PAMC26577_37560 [Caballeronia sordidicola]